MRGTLSADACMIACTIKQDDDGPWSIRSMGVIPASGLPLEPALRQAHEMARTARMDKARPTCVEVIRASTHHNAADERQPELRWCSAAA